MKKIDEYLKKPYTMQLIEDPDEGGYVVSFPELPGCFSSGETLEEAIHNATEAKKQWLEAALEQGLFIKEPHELEDYSGQFKLRIPKSLHRLLARQARAEGVSMNQYCVYLLSRDTYLQNIN